MGVMRTRMVLGKDGVEKGWCWEREIKVQPTNRNLRENMRSGESWQSGSEWR